MVGAAMTNQFLLVDMLRRDDHASTNGEAMNEMTLRVTSADGTRIAYDRKGTGPAVILVGGTLDDGAENAPLARLLADHFTGYNYARRRRGASGNTPHTALAPEVAHHDAAL